MAQVSVVVFDINESVIGDAEAVLSVADSSGALARRVALTFDASLGLYLAEATPGILLTTSAAGRETQRRAVDVTEDGLTETVILGRPGLPHYYRGKVKVPFEKHPGLVAASMEGSPEEVDRRVEEISRRLGLNVVPPGDVLREGRVRLFQLPGSPNPETETRLCNDLAREPVVLFSGPVVSFRKDSLAFLTGELVAQFHPTVAPEEALAAAGLPLTVVRTIPYSRNTMLIRATSPWEALAACDVLVESGQVEFAEPSLVVTTGDAQVVPTDFLFPQQWYAALVQLPAAWDELRLASSGAAGAPGDLTFGSEEIVIAVFDRGIQSETVATQARAVHSDFAGTVTSGAEKISVFFDFATMSPNNDMLVNNHGMLVAGVASAHADNPSVVPGEAEGIAGAAPNCQVMAIIRPDDGRPEVEFSDAYIWMAGFDPMSSKPGFPQQLARGADVICNSFHTSSGAPILRPDVELLRLPHGERS